MTYLRRTGLFLLTNLAVVFLIGLILRITGLDALLMASGFHPAGLLLFAGLFGLTGSLVSLLLSKWLALRSTGASVIEHPRNRTESWLLETIHQQAVRSGIGTPDLAIYTAPEPNAFATGARRDAAVVAVSTGLLQSMDRHEVEAVLAHEVSHIANGDMITMALLQGVTNTFVLFFSRIVGSLVDTWLSGDADRRGPGIGYWVTSIAAEVVFGLFASLIVMAHSRRREFRADAGAARLVGAPAMISALERLARAESPTMLPKSIAAFGIRGTGWARWWSSHPPITARIAALEPKPTRRRRAA
ncbi:MAG: protease HtpX [Deltaproteobacteria bacterium]|nr:protease HtpX [Deltaproteobacteria bacterium]HCH61558.1 protease HtpX [Deltaproteobacteria bacterium]